MTEPLIDDINIRSITPLITPEALTQKIALSDAARKTVLAGRQTIRDILDGKDHRLF